MNVARRKLLLRSAPVVLLAALALSAIAWWSTKARATAETAALLAAPTLPEVDTFELALHPLQQAHEYSARLEPAQEVKIKPLVSGVVTAVHFKAGSIVRRGDLLVSLDTAQLSGALEKAEGDLAAARARWEFSKLERTRIESLAAEHVVPRRNLEQVQHDETEAEAQMKGAQATLRIAGVNLGYAQLRAPIGGRISNISLAVGTVVDAGQNASVLATIVSVTPIYATFQMDEDTYVKELSGVPGRRVVSLELSPAGQPDFSRKGAIDDVDNAFDTATSSIRVRASFDNAKGELVPGVVTRLRFDGRPRPVLFVPQSAIAADQSREFVLKIDSSGTLFRQEVSTGAEVQPGRRIVLSGLVTGDRVVARGLAQLHAGMKVALKRSAFQAPAPRS